VKYTDDRSGSGCTGRRRGAAAMQNNHRTERKSSHSRKCRGQHDHQRRSVR
jgi:hypothetical protein